MSSIAFLGCQPFHDELVALLLRASLDRKDPEREAVVLLLGALVTEGLLDTALNIHFDGSLFSHE